MNSQTDLFDPRPATIIVFPPACRKDLVRAMCDKLERLKTLKQRDAHWCKGIDALAAKYAALGIKPAEIERLIVAFKAACEAEQVRRYIVGHRAERDRKP